MANHTDTSRSGDLVERLREDGYSGHNPLCLEAADRIEALEAEVERLRGVLTEVLSDDEALMDITWVRRARAALKGYSHDQ